MRSSTPNVDLQATISEVRPDGKETFVQSGWVRGNERKLDAAKSTPLEPVLSLRAADVSPLPADRFVQVTIPLYYEGHVYRAGSRIRVTISAPNGDQPIWSFGETRAAPARRRSRSRYSKRMPSRLVLPVVPGVERPDRPAAVPGPARRAVPRLPAVREPRRRRPPASRGDDRGEPGCELLHAIARGRLAGCRSRLSRQLRRLNRDMRLVQGARAAREWLPGDERYGNPLSTGGERPSEVAGRQLTELTAGSPGVLRELGLGAVQVWQALSEAQGRGRGDEELAIVFTDLTGFSTWALERGDTVAVNLLRDVAEALEPALADHGGTIVKRLGDGVMAVFVEPQAAVDGVLDARERVGASTTTATGRACGPASTWAARDGWARTTSAST